MSEKLKDFLLKLYKDKDCLDENDEVLNYLTVYSLRTAWNKLLSKINFAKVGENSRLHIHDLRHIFAQNLLNQGLQIEDIQFILGHADISTTQRRYAMFARPDLNSKVQVIDNSFEISNHLN